jgi:hypothetical protein
VMRVKISIPLLPVKLKKILWQIFVIKISDFGL